MVTSRSHPRVGDLQYEFALLALQAFQPDLLGYADAGFPCCPVLAAFLANSGP